MSDYRELINKVNKVIGMHYLKEALSPEDFQRIGQELATADIRPMDFDVTFEAWLMRIGLWGKVKITHIDPEYKIKEEVSQDRFIKLVTDDNMLKAFGEWKIEQLAFNKLKLYRDYVGLLGKKYREEFIVEVEIKPELLKKKRK